MPETPPQVAVFCRVPPPTVVVFGCGQPAAVSVFYRNRDRAVIVGVSLGFFLLP